MQVAVPRSRLEVHDVNLTCIEVKEDEASRGLLLALSQAPSVSSSGLAVREVRAGHVHAQGARRGRR